MNYTTTKIEFKGQERTLVLLDEDQKSSFASKVITLCRCIFGEGRLFNNGKQWEWIQD